MTLWFPGARPPRAKLAVQFKGEAVPLQAAARGAPPSTVKLNVPVGAFDSEKLTWAVNPTAAAPETTDTGATITAEVGGFGVTRTSSGSSETLKLTCWPMLV